MHGVLKRSNLIFKIGDMIKRRIYIILLCSLTLTFSACARDRRSRLRHIQTDDTELVPNEQVNDSSYPEIWSQEDFDLLAPAMPGYMPSQVLERIGYITSYNHETKCPNWVAWHLTAEHTDGNFSRKGVPYYDDYGNAIGIGQVSSENLRGDYFLDRDAEEPRQLLSDWPNNEYHMTHGHICPAADNRWSKAAMNQSFLLTNMCPQDGALNGGAWQKLEDKCRIWANRWGDVYIIGGPLYANGNVSRTIGESKVAVPDAFFKVILCVKGDPKAIGFVYKNDASSQSLATSCRSVDRIEELTRFDFFTSLDDDIEETIESQCDINDWK